MNKIFSVNNARNLLLCRKALEPHGMSAIRPGYKTTYHFSIDESKIDGAILHVVDCPALSRRFNEVIKGTSTKQCEFIDGVLSFSWSSKERDILQSQVGKRLPFCVEYEVEGEHFSLVEGFIEIDGEFSKTFKR